MASTVPAAKAAIIAAIQARTLISTSGTPVMWEAPMSDADWQAKKELIHLGDVDQTEEFGALGNQRRDEEYDLDIVVLVAKAGDDPQATEQRAWALRDEIKAAIGADATLGGVLTSGWGQIARTQQTNEAFTDGWGTRLTLTVSCRASRI